MKTSLLSNYASLLFWVLSGIIKWVLVLLHFWLLVTMGSYFSGYLQGFEDARAARTPTEQTP